jgi:hypothetical protein
MRAGLLPIVVLLALVSANGATAEPQRRPLAVVVAKGSKVTGMSRADLRRTFTGTTVTAGGQRLVPFNYMPGAAERLTFDREILGMSAAEAGQFWVNRKVRGESSAPRALPSVTHVAKVVARFPGAIGYLPLDRVGPELQIVSIDGLKPGDAGYPLTAAGN